MDEIKDIQKTDNISRFIDGPQLKTNPFGNNRAAERVYRRAERIAAGVHLVTNHISEEEPVRKKVRTEAADLITCALALRNDMRASGSRSVTDFESKIRSIISSVRILSVAGFISIPNAQTLIEALDELGGYVAASQRSIAAESIALSRDDLMDINAKPQYRAPRPMRPIKDNAEIKVTTITSDTLKNTNSIGQVSMRAQSILEVLKTGGALGIRDISINLPEYSEKMIQRELLELVSQGKVSKVGLKRWSRYSLAA